MSQKWYISHAETITQNALGMLIGFCIMHIYGLPFGESVKLQLVFLVASYVRGYSVRRFFEKYVRFNHNET